MKRAIVLLVVILAIIFIQVFLSKRKNKWLGLILPALTLISSFIYLATNTWVHQQEVSLNFVIKLFVIWVAINIPTVMLLGIYLGDRKKQR